MKHTVNALLLTCILAGSEFGAQAKQGDSSSRGQIAWVHFEKANDVYDGKPYLWLGHGDIKLVIDVKPRPDHDLELLWGAKGDIRSATAIANGREVKLSSGGYSGFRWLSVPFPESLSGDKYELLLKKAAPQYAFIAAVRLSGRQTDGSKSAPKSPAHRITFTTSAPKIQPATSPQAQLLAEMHAIWNSPPLPPLRPLHDKNREAAFREAAGNGLQANQAFFRSRLFIDGWLKHADPDTGLIPRNLNRSRDIWNAKDSAADNYPFMVVTAAMTDRELFDGRILEMLRTETRLTSRIGNMPDTWSFSGKGFSTDKANLDSIIFGSSEYMKDGLLAVTEWLGNCPWTDRILEIGRNEHGMIYSSINPIKGTNSGRIVDTWGYTYNAYYTVYMVDKVERYREAVLKAMSSMKEHYTDYRWEGGSNDGYADSIEGGLNLYNRDPVDTIPEWVDHEILYMFKKQKPDGVIEGWHGDGNSARTWLMYSLWKTQGLTVRPWRNDGRFGAVERDGELCISLVADKPWKGILLFDKARHKTNLHLPIDYPRLNQFPEWFVTDSGKEYSLMEVSADVRKQLSGKQLVDGIPLELSPGTELRLSVLPGDGRAISDRKGITFGAATSAIAKKAAENPDPVKLVRKVADAVIRDSSQPPPFNWGTGAFLLAGCVYAESDLK